MKPIEAQLHYKEAVIEDGEIKIEDDNPVLEDVVVNGIIIDVIKTNDLRADKNVDSVYVLFLEDKGGYFTISLEDMVNIRITPKSVHNYVNSFYSK